MIPHADRDLRVGLTWRADQSAPKLPCADDIELLCLARQGFRKGRKWRELLDGIDGRPVECSGSRALQQINFPQTAITADADLQSHIAITVV